jgi:anti-anti-sigma factor
MVQVIGKELPESSERPVQTLCQTTVERGGDASCISLSGNYEVLAAERLEAAIREAQREGVRHLIIDLRRLRSIEADDLGALLGEWSGGRRDGVILILVRVPKEMRPLLEKAGLDRLLPIAYEGVSLRRQRTEA